MLVLKVVWSTLHRCDLLSSQTLALMTDTTLKQKKTLQNRNVERKTSFWRFTTVCVFLTFLIQGILTYTTGSFYL